MSSSEDPRNLTGFEPRIYPLCDGVVAPRPDSRDPIHIRMREFAAAYYRLNEGYERLRKARMGKSTESPSSILADIERAVQARDALEDRLAPEGFYAEAVIEGILTVDLIFSHALKRHAAPETQVVESSFSHFVPLPPPGVDLETHLRRHLAGLFGLDPTTAAGSRRPRKTPPPGTTRTKKKSRGEAVPQDHPTAQPRAAKKVLPRQAKQQVPRPRKPKAKSC